MISKTRYFLSFNAVLLGYGSYYVLNDDHRKRQFYQSLEASYRISNLVSTVAIIAIDYGYHISLRSRIEDKLLLELNEELKSLQIKQEDITLEIWNSTNIQNKKNLQNQIQLNRDRIDQITDALANYKKKKGSNDMTIIHERNAVRLREMCIKNKGVYIKLGQHISMLDHIVPIEYQLELSKLLSNNPFSSIESIRRVISEDLGQLPKDLFQSFDETPIASASLAQVHIAYGKDGKKYAIKVQHEGLKEGSTADRIAITYLINKLSNMFEGFNYNWLSREMNTNLPLELDFINEINNQLRCRDILKDMIDAGDISIPTAIPSLSSSRVLTMSFEEGYSINDMKSIIKAGIEPKHIARTISKTFCEQIFRHGFVHCDPHEANLLIRPHPKKRGHAQLVLLDHGLYKELPDEFRRNYCRLWKALVCSDEANIKYYCQRLNAGNLFTLLSAMLTMRTWDDITSDDMTRLQGKYSDGESEMLQSYARKYFKEIVGLLTNVPSEMLLLLKTNDCLRHLDRKLGAPINTATVVAETTAYVTLREDLKDSKSINDSFKIINSYLNIQIRILALYTAEWILVINESINKFKKFLWL